MTVVLQQDTAQEQPGECDIELQVPPGLKMPQDQI